MFRSTRADRVAWPRNVPKGPGPLKEPSIQSNPSETPPPSRHNLAGNEPQPLHQRTNASITVDDHGAPMNQPNGNGRVKTRYDHPGRPRAVFERYAHVVGEMPQGERKPDDSCSARPSPAWVSTRASRPHSRHGVLDSRLDRPDSVSVPSLPTGEPHDQNRARGEPYRTVPGFEKSHPS